MNIFDEDEVAIHVLTEQLDEARVALVASRAEVRKLRSAVVPLRSIARMTLKEGPSAPLTNSIRSVLAVTSWVDGTEHIDARGFDDGMDPQDRQELNHNLGVMAVTGLICAIWAWRECMLIGWASVFLVTVAEYKDEDGPGRVEEDGMHLEAVITAIVTLSKQA